MKTSMTIPEPVRLDPVSVLRRMSPSDRQYFKEAYRQGCAADAGANASQLAALTALEKNVNAHYPAYWSHPDGSVQATYTAPQATNVTALIGPDGSVHLERNSQARRASPWRRSGPWPAAVYRLMNALNALACRWHGGLICPCCGCSETECDGGNELDCGSGPPGHMRPAQGLHPPLPVLR